MSLAQTCRYLVHSVRVLEWSWVWGERRVERTDLSKTVLRREVHCLSLRTYDLEW